jgi:hypothetical protein
MARFRDAGSLCAGILVGVAILVPLFALVADPGNWQLLWLFGALALLACGLGLQRIVTATERRRRTEPRLCLAG